MADEIRKIANLRTEASAPDLPGRVQNEEFVFDEMIGAAIRIAGLLKSFFPWQTPL